MEVRSWKWEVSKIADIERTMKYLDGSPFPFATV
jgi:hypothetical protein